MEGENWENDSVDSFNAEREKVMLSKAGWGKKNGGKQTVDGKNVPDSVLDVESAKERYLKKLQGDIDESEEEYFVDKDGEDEIGEENEDNWGGKGEYYGDDDENEEVGDVKEALRLQKEHMEQLGMDDYLLEEVEEEWKDQPKEEIEDKTDDIVGLNAYPEYRRLLEELRDLKDVYEELEEGIKRKVLSVYLGVIVCYLGILKTKIRDGSGDMKDESVMLGILKAREMWRQVKDGREGDIREEEEEEGEGKEEEMLESKELGSSSDSELDSESELEEEQTTTTPETDNIDLNVPRTIKKLTSNKLDSLEKEEHKGRRKGLRFYTSKIENRDKRGGGKQQQFTGDDDLLYQETEFDRRRRLQSEAQRRGEKNGPGEDL